MSQHDPDQTEAWPSWKGPLLVLPALVVGIAVRILVALPSEIWLDEANGVLLALTQAGVAREDAYALVQRNAMKVWEKGADFLGELLSDKDVRATLSEEEIRELFDLGYHTRNVDVIFKRVFG